MTFGKRPSSHFFYSSFASPSQCMVLHIFMAVLLVFSPLLYLPSRFHNNRTKAKKLQQMKED